MLALLTRSPKTAVRSPRNRARLGVEHLETRFCPSVTTTFGFTATAMNVGKWIDLQGMVSDPHPTTVVVTFSGVASGSVNPDASGHFDLQTIASGLGVVTATEMSQSGFSSSANATLSVSAPSLTMSLANGPNRQVTLSGKVTDAQPGGLVVTFAGAASGSTTTNADGSYSVTLTATALGQITATTQDVWGLNSAAVSVTVSNAAPTITLSGSQVGNVWTFSGRVTDECPAGLVVVFSGPADLAGQKATVQSDGTYSLTIMLSSCDTGIVTATVTDWWGLAAVAQFALPAPH
jgi:hypothetical protein